MADSYPITITVTVPSVLPTEIVGFDVQPTSVAPGASVTFTGRLKIANSPYSDAIVDGETVWLQQFDPNDDQWKNVLSVKTAFDTTNGGIHGSVTFASNIPSGDYQVRLHYDGNSAKNLAGCE